jgi:hypothetical protein
MPVRDTKGLHKAVNKIVMSKRTKTAKLSSCSINFHTNDGDDKDNDTHLTVTVRDVNQTIAARIDNDFGVFPNNSDNGPFGLIVRNKSSKEDLKSGSVTIRIDPSGRDTWDLNFDIDLVFDDGSHLSCEADGIELAQNRPEQTFAIE